MSNEKPAVRAKSSSLWGRRKRTPYLCHCCGGYFTFCWRCRCGFAICQTCMHENVWGMSCNHITWYCPDCGESNGFGNQ